MKPLMEQKKTANINIREPKKHKKQINQNPYHFAGTNTGSGTVNGSRSYTVTLSLKLVQKGGPITIIRQPILGINLAPEQIIGIINTTNERGRDYFKVKDLDQELSHARQHG